MEDSPSKTWTRVRRLMSSRRKASARAFEISTDNVAVWFVSCPVEAESSTVIDDCMTTPDDCSSSSVRHHDRMTTPDDCSSSSVPHQTTHCCSPSSTPVHNPEEEAAEAAAALIAALAAEASAPGARGPIGFALESEVEESATEGGIASAVNPLGIEAIVAPTGDDATARTLAMLQLQMAALMASQRRTEAHVARIAERLDSLAPRSDDRPRDVRAVHFAANAMRRTPSPSIRTQSKWLMRAADSSALSDEDERSESPDGHLRT